MDDSMKKDGADDSRSTIAHDCQTQEDILESLKRKLLNPDKTLHDHEQPNIVEKSSSSDDKSHKSTTVRTLQNGRDLSRDEKRETNALILNDVEPKGRYRKLCEESSGPLVEAIRGLEELSKRIDDFRQSSLWVNSSDIRNECIKVTTSDSYDSTKDKVERVTSCDGQAGSRDSKYSDTSSGIVDDDSLAIIDSSNPSNKGKKPSKIEITFESGVQLIQELVLETQMQCMKMVNESQHTASRFDDELDRCENEMEALRKELAYAHRCVNDLEVNMMINGSATESDSELLRPEHAMEAEIYRLREDNARLRMQYRAIQRELLQCRQAIVHSNSQNASSSLAHSTPQARHTDTDTVSGLMSCQIGNLQTQQQPTRYSANFSEPRPSSTENNVDEEGNKSTPMNGPESASLANLQLELIHAKEALIALKHDRKRLKAEKVELLNQMKEVYQTLESKERELRDFIRQFEQKMRESDKGIKELIWEKEKIEKEKRQLIEDLEKANQKYDQCRTDLEKEKKDNCKLQIQLKELQGRFLLLTGQQPLLAPTDQLPATSDAKCIQATPGSLGYASLSVSPIAIDDCTGEPPEQAHQKEFPKSCNNIFTAEEAAVLRRFQKPNQENKRSSRMLSQLDDTTKTTYFENEITAISDVQSPSQQGPLRKERDRKTGSELSPNQERSGGAANRLSRLFHFTSASGRSKSKDDQQYKRKEIELNNRSSSTFAVDAIAADLNLVEKADQLLQARQIPMARWRQSHVIAWLELELGMYSYSAKFMDNVKSGKVLLNLTDNEIENILGVSLALHKKKLRLAIEEYRAPALCKFPTLKEVTNQYVCRQWLPSLGMPQYIQAFRQQLIDGRLLNYLNKKQLDKYLGVTRRFHQLAILKGIELLRLFNFDIKALSKRRLECERENIDLLVWTNARLSKWCEQIDLGEYADNLRESGLHGGLCVLDSSFTVDTLASALGIPSGRQMVRKHLAAEFIPLMNQARNQLESHQSEMKTHGNRSGGSLGRAFSRSYTINGDHDFASSTPPADPKQQRLSSKRRRGLRGSIGRVFGLRVRRSTGTSDNSNEENIFMDEMSPARSSTIANLGFHSTSTNTQDCIANLQPQQTSTPANASSPKPLNRSTGTLSSTTSDLGSSIERSQHMKAILGTPKVLAQPPLTSMNSSSKPNCNGQMVNPTNARPSPSDTSDLSRLQHLCLSPGEVMVNGGTGVNGRNPLIRLRNKARHGIGDVPKMGVGASGVDVILTRSPRLRPHSVGDFGGLASYYSNNPNSNSSNRNAGDKKNGVASWKQADSNLTSRSTDVPESDHFMSFSPKKLQSWLSAEHFTSTGNGQDFENGTRPAFQNGHEQSKSTPDTYTNQNGHTQQSFAMGTIAEQGEPADGDNDSISREYNPQATTNGYKHQIGGNSNFNASPAHSLSSVSPSRRDRPRSLLLRAVSATSDLNCVHYDKVHGDGAFSRYDHGLKRNVNIRDKSLPPLASVDSIHETDL